MRIVDLKEKKSLVGQYTSLRNNYTELLLTLPVNKLDTEEWLKRGDIEIRGFVNDNVLLGAVILYLSRDGEIAIFVEENSKTKGIGTLLLKEIENVGKKRKLEFIWGWALKANLSAQRFFKKNGFIEESITKKRYKGATKEGIKYKKILN